MSGLLGRLFGGGEPQRTDTATPGAEERNVASAPEPEGPIVVAYLRLTDPELLNDREQMHVFSLEDRVMRAIYDNHVGTYEGNYLDRGFMRLYASGDDVDRLETVMRDVLQDAPRGSLLVKRNGPPGTEEERITL